MELRHYWRVLLRRGAVVRNTFLLVALLSAITVAYSYYGALYKGTARLGVQVHKETVNNAVVDPLTAANQNTVQAVTEIQTYASGTRYFQLVSAELQHRYHVNIDWKTIQQSMKIYPVPDSHDIYIEWSGSNQTTVGHVETVAVDQIIAFIPQYRQLANTPPIGYSVVDPPYARRVGLSTPLINFVLRAAIGLVAGVILAYLFEYLDDTVQDEADVRHWMGVPTLAVIPGGRQVRRARSA